MKTPDQVFSAAQINSSFAADCRVHLREERSWNL
jgi:hypothetical protein